MRVRACPRHPQEKGQLAVPKESVRRQWLLIWVPGLQSEKEGAGGGTRELGPPMYQTYLGDVYHCFFEKGQGLECLV